MCIQQISTTHGEEREKRDNNKIRYQLAFISVDFHIPSNQWSRYFVELNQF